MKTKLFTLCVAIIAATTLFAYDCEVDGIYYNLNIFEMTAEVTSGGSNYSGSVTIPSSIIYESKTYSVTTIGNEAFEGCSGLTSVTIGNSVTTIGNMAFEYCSGLTSVTIGNSVTTIGRYAFQGCSGLTSITIPYSVTAIGKNVFSFCSGLTTIDVDAANTHYGSIDGVLFNYAKDTLIQYPAGNTRTIYTIPNSVTTIGYMAFAYFDGLTSVIIPNSVTTIGDWAFCGCSGLTSVTIPNSVITIGEKAFEHCSGLTSVTIPNSVITIGSGAFYGCSGLTSVTIGNSVTTIGDYAFYNCSGLTSVTIPNSVTTIGYEAFYLVNNIVYNGTATGSPWRAKCVNGYVDGYLVYSDAAKTILCGCSTAAIGEIMIPDSVTTIGNYAFYNCSGLTSVTIPNSVTTIGYEAFYECSGLTSVTIPNSVTTIGDYAFSRCEGLTSITIPNSVTTIGNYAFSRCFGLTSVTIPNSVTTIGNYAFYHVNNIVYNGTATGSPWGAKCVNGYVDGYLVYSDASKTTLCGCSSAAKGEIIIPNSVITIGEKAFEYCSGLTSVTIGNSVTTIGEDAFYNCSGLTSITIPNSVTTIGNYAFFDCSSLASVTIGNSVTTIGERAFAYCSGLASVTIGNSVTTIGEDAFWKCSGLTSITCYAVTPPECGYDVFYYISQDAKVYVPASALTDYQNAEVWKDMQLYPIAADVTPMDDENPVVTPTDQDVTITWPITDGTDTYTLTITKNGETVCVLTFNANGQLTNIAFAAPGHNGAHQAPAATLTAQGYQFTVTGLNPGTAYNYSVVATDAEGETIAEHTGNFSTTGGTGLESVHDARCTMHKVLRNGQLLIETNNATYTPIGQKVR